MVASFHSTLAEAHDASLLLYVVDASDPTFRTQLDVVHEVLGEVGVDGIDKLLVLNKSDQLTPEQQQALMEEFPDAMMTSTRNPLDVAKLHKYIVNASEKGMIEEELIVPYDAKGIMGEIRSSMSVVNEEYDYDHMKLTVRSSAIDLARLKKLMSNVLNEHDSE